MKVVRNYLLVTILCAAFGAIYEAFSFGVYSNFMIYAFGWPLVFGVIPALHLYVRDQGKQRKGAAGAGKWPGRLWHTGVAVLTVGSIFRGVLDIYGTGSRLTMVYWIVGGITLCLGLTMIARTELNRSRNLTKTDI
ncbi:MAG: hypothetical protein IK081_04690 [Lachnospiraceae bacterium]|nr:hypothetical protein [Lachnospiraceae bacterium]